MRNAMFIDRKIWVDYLITEPQDDKPQPTDNDLKEAFTWGYVASLHVHAILDCKILFGEDIDHVHVHVGGEIHSECRFDSVTARIINANLWDQTARYLFNDKAIRDVDETCKNAFIAGYKVALIVHDYYDRCLFMGDEDAFRIITADLLSYEKRNENAISAAARIFHKYDESLTEEFKDECRKMMKDDESINNTGNGIAEIHAENDTEITSGCAIYRNVSNYDRKIDTSDIDYLDGTGDYARDEHGDLIH